MTNDGLPREASTGEASSRGQAGSTGEASPARTTARRPGRTSRHSDLGIYRRDLDRAEVVLFEPRLRESPPAERTYRVLPGDRLDLLAAREYGDPHQYWRLADANPAEDPDALELPGRDLSIPEGA